nr:MAG TPA: hypothetical protein [Caudoviricetes sp.]
MIPRLDIAISSSVLSMTDLELKEIQRDGLNRYWGLRVFST